ncbi:MAG: T9SS type A sorting domain-containing protein [Ignavibacteriaceae bacterium]|nr:T9SS type A sorting domain-containing protein [Ignavibacteriaceae bacterium]
MKKINLFLLLITLTTLLNFSFLNAQWYEVSSNLPSEWFAFKIDALDSLTAIGPLISPNHDSVFITTNGGLTWNPIYQPTTYIDDISMVNTQKIWLSSCGSPEIYATSDGGNNWQLQFYDTLLTPCINYIEMFDSLNGIAMGDSPQVDKPALFLRTTDGGNNWISMNQNYLIGLYSGDLWRRVDFVDINTGYFYSSGESSKKLYKTTNGGEYWGIVNDTMGFCQVLKFYDENFGFVYPSPNGIYKTTDGGATWANITIPSSHRTWGDDIEFSPSNPSKIWIATNTTIFSSADSGNTWIEQTYDHDMHFYDLIFTDEECGWLIGANVNSPPLYPSYIYRTTNGGVGGIVSVKDNSFNRTISNFTLYQNYPNPFNPTTNIKFQIAHSGFVSLKVYDILGNAITTIINEEKPVGNYEVEFNATDFPSGIYFYQLKTGVFFQTKKMVYLK